MIRFLENHNLDKEKWDERISSSTNRIVYAYSWYLDIVAPNWGALVDGDYKTVMPLPTRQKMGIKYVFQPFFVQQLGVFGQDCGNPETAHSFVNAVPKRFKIIETNLNTHNQLENTNGTQNGVTHHLELIEPYDQIRRKYSENALRNIKRAEKLGVYVAKGGSPDLLIAAFKKTKGREISKLAESDYKTLQRLVYTGIHRGQASVEFAYTPENNFCAGAVFFETFNKSIFLFSATTAEGKENGAMSLLIDSYIKKKCNKDIVLDFEGSKIPSLARFYKSFGSKECVFLQIRKNTVPRVFTPLVKFYQFLRNKP
jgi:hypothetical protein